MSDYDEPSEFSPEPAPESPPLRHPADLVYVGFNSRIVALDRETGELVWKWKAPEGAGFVAVLFDSDRLLASVQGYTYCLDPSTGGVLWSNPLKGFGLGTPCIATVAGNTSAASLLGDSAAQQQQQQAAGA